jgi:2-iminobutanoate/2-iminopropanoate deaminase
MTEQTADSRVRHLSNHTGNPTSAATIIDGMIFTGGQVGQHRETKEIPESFEDQVRIAFDNLTNTLERAGGSLDTVVKARVYVTDRANFQAMNKVYAELMPAPYPSRCTVVAGLALEELQFEIEVVAHLA